MPETDFFFLAVVNDKGTSTRLFLIYNDKESRKKFCDLVNSSSPGDLCVSRHGLEALRDSAADMIEDEVTNW